MYSSFEKRTVAGILGLVEGIQDKTILNMLEKLKEDVNKVKKILCEQNEISKRSKT